MGTFITHRGARTILLALFVFLQMAAAQTEKAVPELLIRCDDIGMCQAVNMAAEMLMQSGIPFSASVMFACPWHQQAVDFLRQYPQISVGVHLTLNAEWKGYRWGPVAGWKTVPSLTDSSGYFFPSRDLLAANDPSLEEIELELRAQIERAKKSGLQIDYIDYHMGAVVETLERRQIVEKLAKENGWAISRYFGEADAPNVYAVATVSKMDSLVRVVHNLKGPRTNLLVCHIGLDTPEMGALVDLNTFGLAKMSEHRQAELFALLSPQFRTALRERGVKLRTYRDLVDDIGLDKMKRPDLL